MNPVFTIWPTAALRAQRNYLHSTDLYNELVSALKSRAIVATSFDLKIRDKITTLPRFDFYQGDCPVSLDRPAALAKFATAEGSWVVLVSHGHETISTRKAYDESPLREKIKRSQTGFEIRDCEGFAPIEVVTAVGVFAHNTLHPPAPSERWLLGQIVANRMLDLDEVKYFKTDVVRQLGPKMTQSNLIGEAGVFGKMVFILK